MDVQLVLEGRERDSQSGACGPVIELELLTATTPPRKPLPLSLRSRGARRLPLRGDKPHGRLVESVRAPRGTRRAFRGARSERSLRSRALRLSRSAAWRQGRASNAGPSQPPWRGLTLKCRRQSTYIPQKGRVGGRVGPAGNGWCAVSRTEHQKPTASEGERSVA